MMEAIAENWPLIIALAGSGAVAGFMAGMFGIGGGAVLVPVLYQALTFLGIDEAVRMHLSVGTSLAIIIPTSLRSFQAHRKAGAVDMELLKGWLFFVPIGTVFAALIAGYLSGNGLKGVFGFIALAVACKLLFARQDWRLGDDLPGNPWRGGCGVLIGFFSTLMGIGGGVMNNTFMTLFNRPIHQAVATSSGVGVLISIPGAIGLITAGLSAQNLPPFSIGFINILGIILIMPITVLFAPLGVKVAHALSKRTLEIVFGIFLLSVAIRFIAGLF